MSKIGKLPIDVKEGVTVSVQGETVSVSGAKGSMSYRLPEGIEVKQEKGKIQILQKMKGLNRASEILGTTRAHIANMVKGVSEGFEKKLELSGVGYRAQVIADELILSVGFSHTVKVTAREGIHFSVSENIITVTGVNKQLVGDVAAKIRAIRPPEPYKGKGIAYVGERIRRKAGKVAKAVGVK